ncbi:MAG: hypothetical protein K6T81_15230 [Alicyclobacillus macrosporangiidus]|uniref:hypothetical protein n=1 Tax=Alicyclobacillus macrosporangiidus TaxID=392015 RepID=UPI0026F271A6|nr:hypothetical protein [Alicyclobacillus macrosporangiidus]MCL6600069.1 hypothetical protein [Alicyclobacillus macrosporangiidus]
MDRFDPEYMLMEELTNRHADQNGKFPSLRDYRASVREAGFPCPSAQQLIEKYGSFNPFVDSFLKTYVSLNVCPLPDYLLGFLAYRAKVIHASRRFHLRFLTHEMEHIRILQQFARHLRCYKAKEGKPTLMVRIYDAALVTGLERFYTVDNSFRPTVDFVRGYIDTHSHFRIQTPGKYRLTIWGPLVPQCHDFLVRLGARNTRVHSVGESYRMNLHCGSLRKIRHELYPLDCLCNEQVRMMLYKA